MRARNVRSAGNSRSGRGLRLVVFAVCFPLLLAVFYVIRRPGPMEDFSGGRFSETFRTEYRPLRRELLHLNRIGFFGKEPKCMPIPESYSGWRSAPETERILQGESFRSREYDALIRKSLSAAEKAKHLVFQSPLENPVQGELFLCLLRRFELAMKSSDPPAASEFLRDMFRFSSISLNSNSPDIYFLGKSVSCAKEYERRFSDFPAATAEWRKLRAGLMENCSFPFAELCRLDRERSMRDFEKIRLNGVRLFDGHPEFGTRMKEALCTMSFSLAWDALKTKITDFLYDIDRDQTANLAIYREILENGATPQTVAPPKRKMSIRSLRRLTRDQDILTESLRYLSKEPEE